MATFSVHYDGPITIDHRVSLRVLTRTYEHMQRAIDRSFLIEEYGSVWKHARLTERQYAETEFIAEWPREGGIILDAVRAGAESLIDRVQAAAAPLFEKVLGGGLEQHATLAQQLGQRKEYVQQMRGNTTEFSDLIENPRQAWADAYSNRSILKEIDQLVQIITPDRLDGSTCEIQLIGTQSNLPMEFNALRAGGFHMLAASKEYGPAFIAEINIRDLDRGNKYRKPKARVLNLSTQREVTLQLSSQTDVVELHAHYLKETIRVYVAPIMEAGGFDVNGGDLVYLAIAD